LLRACPKGAGTFFSHLRATSCQVDGRTGDGRGWNTIFRELWKDEGMRGMFKGVVARMWYMGANSLCVITAYEVRTGERVRCAVSTARALMERELTGFRRAPRPML
jgi:hypothetical protein